MEIFMVHYGMGEGHSFQQQGTQVSILSLVLKGIILTNDLVSSVCYLFHTLICHFTE